MSIYLCTPVTLHPIPTGLPSIKSKLGCGGTVKAVAPQVETQLAVYIALLQVCLPGPIDLWMLATLLVHDIVYMDTNGVVRLPRYRCCVVADAKVHILEAC